MPNVLSVQELIDQLQQVGDKKKPVSIMLVIGDGDYVNDKGEAISLNPCPGIHEFDDYVAIMRLV